MNRNGSIPSETASGRNAAVFHPVNGFINYSAVANQTTANASTGNHSTSGSIQCDTIGTLYQTLLKIFPISLSGIFFMSRYFEIERRVIPLYQA